MVSIDDTDPSFELPGTGGSDEDVPTYRLEDVLDGVLRDELLGHRRISKRALFLLDSDGTVQYRWVGEIPETVPDLTPLYEALEDLSES